MENELEYRRRAFIAWKAKQRLRSLIVDIFNEQNAMMDGMSSEAIKIMETFKPDGDAMVSLQLQFLSARHEQIETDAKK